MNGTLRVNYDRYRIHLLFEPLKSINTPGAPLRWYVLGWMEIAGRDDPILIVLHEHTGQPVFTAFVVWFVLTSRDDPHALPHRPGASYVRVPVTQNIQYMVPALQVAIARIAFANDHSYWAHYRAYARRSICLWTSLLDADRGQVTEEADGEEDEYEYQEEDEDEYDTDSDDDVGEEWEEVIVFGRNLGGWFGPTGTLENEHNEELFHTPDTYREILNNGYVVSEGIPGNARITNRAVLAYVDPQHQSYCVSVALNTKPAMENPLLPAGMLLLYALVPMVNTLAQGQSLGAVITHHIAPRLTLSVFEQPGVVRDVYDFGAITGHVRPDQRAGSLHCMLVCADGDRCGKVSKDTTATPLWCGANVHAHPRSMPSACGSSSFGAPRHLHSTRGSLVVGMGCVLRPWKASSPRQWRRHRRGPSRRVTRSCSGRRSRWISEVRYTA
jgi:hypothetical protein